MTHTAAARGTLCIESNSAKILRTQVLTLLENLKLFYRLDCNKVLI